jgi:DNA-binding XRE family transcriptional regulator
MPSSAEETLVRLTVVRRAASDGSARLARIAAGASLAEVGRASGVTKATISKWERGLAVPRCAGALQYGYILAILAQKAEPV